MPQTVLEMAKDLVTEQILVHRLSPDAANDLLVQTHTTLICLAHMEANTSEPVEPPDWQHSITQHAVTCLECGASFRQLSIRHLKRHDLTSQSYRVKYGIPNTQPLSARTATARRRAIAWEVRPWEQAVKMRGAKKKK